jgi:hypothetical protein
MQIIEGIYCTDYIDDDGSKRRVWKSGGESYFDNKGEYHRIDGPATTFSYVMHDIGPSKWYIHGKRINCNSQEEFERILKLKAFW